MKKAVFSLCILAATITSLVAQEEQSVDKPVVEPFASGYLIDNQTTLIPYPKTLEFVIQHKFGTLENGKSDIWGIYNSANVRLALNYVIIKNLQVGYGLTKSDMVHDFSAIWTFFEQTRKNTIPLSMAVYANMGISGVEDDLYGDNYEFTNRFSYFSQLIVSRKFTDRITLQAGTSFTHFNQADTSDFDFDRIGLHLNGRIKVTEQGSVVFNFDQPLKALQLTKHEDISLKPNVAIGYEIATVSHAFQIYMGYSKEILPQYYMMRERKDFEFEQFNIGFTITRLSNF
ncbi:MAG TPA: hypothetical protein DCY97_14410 [Marinilabiliales bacterium]|nr:hypothetical protein [Marinilabiliales bacterium]